MCIPHARGMGETQHLQAMYGPTAVIACRQHTACTLRLCGSTRSVATGNICSHSLSQAALPRLSAADKAGSMSAREAQLCSPPRCSLLGKE